MPVSEHGYDPRIDDPARWGMYPAQRETLLTIYAKYPPPMVIGWQGDRDFLPGNAECVRGSLYRTVEDDENGAACGKFSIYRDGTIHWWSKPARETRGRR